MTSYCGQDCCKRDWETHKLVCAPVEKRDASPPATIEDLARALLISNNHNKALKQTLQEKQTELTEAFTQVTTANKTLVQMYENAAAIQLIIASKDAQIQQFTTKDAATANSCTNTKLKAIESNLLSTLCCNRACATVRLHVSCNCGHHIYCCKECGQSDRLAKCKLPK